MARSVKLVTQALEDVYHGIGSVFFFLHEGAYQGATKHYHVPATLLYIYFFPFIVSLLFQDSNGAASLWATSIAWYAFLLWFFLNKGKSQPPYPALNLKLLLPLLFVFEGVCNPRYLSQWNGGERLVFSFVLLSMKSGGFSNWRTFLSLGSLLLAAAFVGEMLAGQWCILVVALSCIHTAKKELSAAPEKKAATPKARRAKEEQQVAGRAATTVATMQARKKKRRR